MRAFLPGDLVIVPEPYDLAAHRVGGTSKFEDYVGWIPSGSRLLVIEVPSNRWAVVLHNNRLVQVEARFLREIDEQ